MLPPVTFASDDPRAQYKGVVVAVGGPPDSGKSVFVAELYEQLCHIRSRGVFLERCNPDGEGQWRHDNSAPIVEQLHKRAENKFNGEFFNSLIEGLPGLIRAYPLLLLDLGGMRSPENARILRLATHGLIVSHNQKKLREWNRFMIDQGCQPAVHLLTKLCKGASGEFEVSASSVLDTRTKPATGTLINLIRGNPTTPYAREVMGLAHWFLDTSS